MFRHGSFTSGPDVGAASFANLERPPWPQAGLQNQRLIRQVRERKSASATVALPSVSRQPAWLAPQRRPTRWRHWWLGGLKRTGHRDVFTGRRGFCRHERQHGLAAPASQKTLSVLKSLE